jgi:hypothetical protein
MLFREKDFLSKFSIFFPYLILYQFIRLSLLTISLNILTIFLQHIFLKWLIGTNFYLYIKRSRFSLVRKNFHPFIVWFLKKKRCSLMILVQTFSVIEQFYYSEESQQKEIKIDSIFRTKVHLKYITLRNQNLNTI